MRTGWRVWRKGAVDALAVVAQVARESISILYPNPREAAEVLSRVPQAGEKILIISDSRLDRECADCMVDPSVAPDEIRNIILRLYGPDATDQLVGDDITSRTFADLAGVAGCRGRAGPWSRDCHSHGDACAHTGPTPDPAVRKRPDWRKPHLLRRLLRRPARLEDDGLDKNSKTAKYIDEADWIIFAMLDVDEERTRRAWP